MAHEPIPIEERTSLLKPLLRELLSEMHGLKGTELLAASIYDVDLHGIVYPWVVREDFKTDQTEAAKAKFLEFGVDGATLVQRLQSILDDDRHLRECCVSPLLSSPRFLPQLES